MGNFQNLQINSPLCSKEMYKTRQNEWKVYFNRYWETPKHNTEKVISLQTVNEKNDSNYFQTQKVQPNFLPPLMFLPRKCLILAFLLSEVLPLLHLFTLLFLNSPFPHCWLSSSSSTINWFLWTWNSYQSPCPKSPFKNQIHWARRTLYCLYPTD